MGIVLAALASLSLAAPAVAGNNPGVLPPQSRPHGASYGQWGARWWQWLFQTPASKDNQVLNNGQVLDNGTVVPAQVNCALGQSGHVWFIGGALEATFFEGTLRVDAFRACSIPTGTFLFFPVFNSEFDNLTSACPPPATFTAKKLTDAATGAIDHIVPGSMTATIDGVSVSGLADSKSIYRASSPSFSYTLPEDNVAENVSGCSPPVVYPAGTTPPPPGATADGIYLMLAPLSPGVHTISFGGEANIPAGESPPLGPGAVDFIQNINYTITVVPRGHFPT
jgi:hypothetical protein